MKPHKFREVWKKLKKHDRRFIQDKKRGHGSERLLIHPDINGRKQSYPIKCHGENTEIRKGTLSAIIRRFGLPRDFFD